MRARRDSWHLAQIARIREVQHLAAESEAARAAMVVAEKQAQLREKEARQEEIAAHWVESVTGPVLSLEFAGLWSLTLRVESDALEVTRRGLKAAGEEADRKRRVLHAAESRRDEANTEAWRSYRREAERREERALQEALDIHVHRAAQR